MERFRSLIRDVPDFPTPGVLFKDITPLLRDARALSDVTELLAARYREHRIDLVAGIESRGFLFGAPLAVALGTGFIPIRKKGKLPARAISREYSLEYGVNHLEMHRDSVDAGQRVVVIDDVLATGGTAKAGAEMIQELGGEIVEIAFLIELAFLRGRAALGAYNVYSVLQY